MEKVETCLYCDEGTEHVEHFGPDAQYCYVCKDSFGPGHERSDIHRAVITTRRTPPSFVMPRGWSIVASGFVNDPDGYDEQGFSHYRQYWIEATSQVDPATGTNIPSDQWWRNPRAIAYATETEGAEVAYRRLLSTLRKIRNAEAAGNAAEG